MGAQSAGWYPDPDDGPGLRWFDGEQWTDDRHIENAGPSVGPFRPDDPTARLRELFPIGVAPRAIPEGGRSPFGHFRAVLTEHYVDLGGRASRAEFWWFTAIDLVVTVGVMVLAIAVVEPLIVVAVLWMMATLPPRVSVAVRRLHDSGRSGLTMLVLLLPLGAIVLAVFLALRGDDEANRFGLPPM